MFYVDLSLDQAIEKLKEHMENTYITVSLIDEYTIELGESRVVSLIFEEYFIRVKNRLSLTVVMDDTTGRVRIHKKAGGSQTSRFFDFDYGAGFSFEKEVELAFDY